FEKNGNHNEIIASSYHLNNDNVKYYIEALIKFNPLCIKAYPSSLFILAQYVNENYDLTLNKIKTIILASENIYEYQKDLFKQVFPNAKVFSFYGHTEHACLAGQCELNEYYHLQSEYGYTELINEHNQNAIKENELGEIVATSFNNYAMPIIRYKTSDIAVHTNEECNCGRNYNLVKRVEGRLQEYIYTDDGTKISLTSLIHSQHIDALGRVKQFQLVQNDKGKVNIKIVKNSNFKKNDINQIVKKIEQAANHNLKVKIQIVNNIEKTARGKHKFLIQNIIE
ncbi:MAG: hypothetical protein ACTHY0_09580, partial [Mammaliicoccus vitulinus]